MLIGTVDRYGFRVIGPLLIGASRLPPRIFLPLSIVGALVWALLFTTIGYLGGEVVGPWLHHLDAHLAPDLADPRGGGGGGRPLVAQAARE